jgi:hypothetical protein
VRVSPSPIRKPCFSFRCAFIVLALTSAPLAAAPADSEILARGVAGPLSCEIQKSQNGDMVRLEGVATGLQPLTGTSHFIMIKSGTSGSSNMAQSQHFALKAQQRTVVGQATTNLDPGGYISIDFSAQAQNGLTCTARASLKR